MKFTERRIEALICADEGRKDALFFDEGQGGQRGLAVRVTAAGGKTYLAQYSFAGQKRRVPLGACASITLDAARKAAAAILGAVAQGRDPAAARKADAREAKRKADIEALTLAALIEQWEGIRLADKRESYAGEAVRALRFAFDKHLKRPAADLTRRIVVQVLDDLSKAGKVAMAARTAAYGRACFSWAIKRGSLTENPFAALPLAPVEKRERVLSDDELRAIWKATTGQGSFNSIVRALILSGQRREEVARMTWGELAADLSMWTIPAARAKNDRAHILPLSAPMRDLIEANKAVDKAGAALRPKATAARSAFVFPGRDGPFNGFGKAKAALDDASGVTGWRLHDLRRTMATGLQKLGVRLEVTEAVLNHIGGSRAGIVGVYQRHDYAWEKRAALDAWGEALKNIIETSEAASNVVKLRA